MRVLILGAGICGLGTALLLARDGHDVTVVERDAADIPESAQAAWDCWTRPGVAQFRQPHNFMPGLRLLLEAELPDVQNALACASAGKFDLVNPMPPSFNDHSSRPIDDKLWTWTARRPVGEWVFADTARREPRITIRRGVLITGLISGARVIAGTPHVIGIRTAGGEEFRADVVVDATGRQSRASDWLAAIGARRPRDEQEESGFIYYTRYFSGTPPQRRGAPLTQIGTIALLTLPGDNNTWSVTIFVAAGDQPLKGLRREDIWTRVVRACPLHAHWLDGEPLTSVLAIGGVVDRYRHFVVDGARVGTGFVAIADAWACTNPSAGRGLTVGMLHGAQLRDALRSAGNPAALVEEFDTRTEANIRPWYDAQIAVDRMRFAEMNALRDGQPPPPPAHPLANRIRSLMSAMAFDPELFRAGLEYIGTVTPIQHILERSAVGDAIHATAAALKRRTAGPVPGPNRAQLLEIAGAS